MHFCMKRLQPWIQNSTLCIRMDSEAAVTCLMKGGGHESNCNSILQEIWTWCKVHKVRTAVEWVPREANQRADLLSKRMAGMWRPKAKTLRIMRAQWSIEEFIKEAKTVSMMGQKSVRWVCPDFNRIGFMIGDIIRRRRKVILLHPVWEAQYWWPILLDNRTQWCDLPGKIEDNFDLDRTDAPKVAPGWKMQMSYFKPKERLVGIETNPGPRHKKEGVKKSLSTWDGAVEASRKTWDKIDKAIAERSTCQKKRKRN